MQVKLAKSNSIFYDPETKFRLSGNEVKEIEDMGYLTRQWLNGGGIVKVVVEEPLKYSYSGPEFIPVDVEPDVTKDPFVPESEDAKSAIGVDAPQPEQVGEQTYIKALMKDKTLTELKKMAKDRGFGVKKNSTPYTLAKYIIRFDTEK